VIVARSNLYLCPQGGWLVSAALVPRLLYFWSANKQIIFDYTLSNSVQYNRRCSDEKGIYYFAGVRKALVLMYSQ